MNEGMRAPAPADNAHTAYAAWLRTHAINDTDAFDRLCAEHPTLAADLRKLHEVAKLVQSLAASAPFHHSLREMFGEEAEVKLTLDDDIVSRSHDEKATMVDAMATSPSAIPSDVQTSDRYALQGEVA